MAGARIDAAVEKVSLETMVSSELELALAVDQEVARHNRTRAAMSAVPTARICPRIIQREARLSHSPIASRGQSSMSATMV